MKIIGIKITKKRILWCAALTLVFSLALVGTVSALTTGAWFYDIETSNGNNYKAGSLDLKIDGDDINVVKFEVDNMVPDSGVKGTWVLKNAGTIDGYLDLEDIIITSSENGRLDAEIDAGDTTDNVGELQDRVHLSLFIDNNGDQVYQPGSGNDELIYNGKVGSIANKYLLNKLMAAGSELNIVAECYWYTAPYPPATPWTQPHLDNLAMGDSFTLDITFELGQTEPL